MNGIWDLEVTNSEYSNKSLLPENTENCITLQGPHSITHLSTRFQFLSRSPFRLFQTVKTPGLLVNIFPRFKRTPTLLLNGDRRTTHSLLRALSQQPSTEMREGWDGMLFQKFCVFYNADEGKQTERDLNTLGDSHYENTRTGFVYWKGGIVRSLRQRLFVCLARFVVPSFLLNHFLHAPRECVCVWRADLNIYKKKKAYT
jgi:hypothetical protein